MEKTIDYYYTPLSPWAYFGHQRFGELAERQAAKICHKPCSILDVFAATGGMPAGQRPPSRQAYRMAELKRWREFLGVELTLTPKFFPVSDELACRLIISYENEMDRHTITQALMRATWAQERDISDEEILVQISNENGFDGPQMLKKAKENAPKDQLGVHTEQAIAANVFGAPSYVYEGDVFWGQDRLELLEIALKK